jgi:hypothetical protein
MTPQVRRLFRTTYAGAEYGFSTDPFATTYVFEETNVSFYEAVFGRYLDDFVIPPRPVARSMAAPRGLYGGIFGGNHSILSAQAIDQFSPSLQAIALGGTTDHWIQQGGSLAGSVWGADLPLYAAAGRTMISLIEELQTEIDEMIIAFDFELSQRDNRINALENEIARAHTRIDDIIQYLQSQ